MQLFRRVCFRKINGLVMFVMGLIVVLSFLWSYRYWHGMHIVKPKVFPLVENTNNETINNVWKAARNESARLHLIIQFPVLQTSGSSQDTNYLVKRQQEYVYCLQQNLLSPHVQEIHVLCERDQDRHFIKALNLVNNRKLVFHSLGKRMTYKDVFQFASNHLLHKNTMTMHGDCHIGKGFEHLDENILGNKTMYFLTRHDTPENVHRCSHAHAEDLCGPTSRYLGSHDAFIFRLHVPVPPQLLDKIDYRPDIYGIEQVMMFNLRTYGGYKIKNPCRILYIIHHHCVKSGTAETNNLFQGQRLDDYWKLSASHQGAKVQAPFSDL